MKNKSSIFLIPRKGLKREKLSKLAAMALAAGLITAAAPVFSGQEKVVVCHKGRDIVVAMPALVAHLLHGDILGSCEGR